MRWALTSVLIVAASCGGGTAVVEPVAVAPASTASTLDPFAGGYTLTGAPSHDGCAGDIYLAAQNVVVDPSSRTLAADVVDRTYEARAEGRGLVAEGRFDADTACPGSTLYERWVLEPASADVLSGTLTSTWLLPPDCMHPCTVEFSVEARRGAR